MGVRQFQLGKQHALEGHTPLYHRDRKVYDSKSAQMSYDNGYAEGSRLRDQQREIDSGRIK